MGAAGGGSEVLWGEHSTLAGYTLLRGVDLDRSGALVVAIDASSGRRVLARILSPALRSDGRAMRRLRADIARLQGVRSPHLVSGVRFDRRAGAVLFDAVEGTSLSRLLQGHEGLDPAAAFCAIDDILVALQALHSASLVHRDIRSGCVVVDDRGDVWLRDSCVPEPPLRPGGPPGNPNAMAPELWHGAPASPASDLYSLTCVFVEALTGAPPFPTADLSLLLRQHETGFNLAELPPKVRPMTGRGLDPNPATRQHDAAQYRADLDVTASTLLGDGWRERGRAWLAREARRVPAPPAAFAPAALPGMAFDAVVPPAPAAAAPAAGAPVIIAGSEEEEVRPARVALWRRPAAWSAVLIALLTVVAVVLVAAAAGTRDPGTPGSSPPPASPSGVATSAAPSSAVGTPAATAPPVTAAPPTATMPPRTAAPVTPNASPPALQTASPRPLSSPTPTPTRTPCLVTPPAC